MSEYPEQVPEGHMSVTLPAVCDGCGARTCVTLPEEADMDHGCAADGRLFVDEANWPKVKDVEL